MNICLIKH
jgi:hypothetical protein